MITTITVMVTAITTPAITITTQRASPRSRTRTNRRIINNPWPLMDTTPSTGFELSFFR